MTIMFLHEYLVTLAEDYWTKKVSHADIDNKLKAGTTRVISLGKKIAGANQAGYNND